MTDLIAEVFRQNEWANLRIIDVCRGLTDEQLDATATGTYGTIRDTLVHLVDGEASYVRRFGGNLGSQFDRTKGWPGFDSLEAVVREAATALSRFAATDGEATLRLQEENGQIEYGKATVVLAQALNHGAEHRAHICTVLTTLGIAPPELDGWTWGEDTGRLWMEPA